MAEVKPVKLAYISAEPKDGAISDQPPIILHHGMTAYKEHWGSVMQILADETRRKVYSVDARNHGDSEKTDVFSFSVLPADLVHFMEILKIPKATFIGHSMGGVASMLMALTKPEKVEKIVVEDMTPEEIHPQVSSFIAKMMTTEMESIKEIPADADEDSAQKIILKDLIEKVPELFEKDKKAMDQFRFPIRKTEKGYEWKTNLPVLIAAMSNREQMTIPQTGIFNGESLFIYGTDSFIQVQKDKDLILKLFPKAQFHAVEGAGHELHSSRQDEFVEAVLKFLKK